MLLLNKNKNKYFLLILSIIILLTLPSKILSQKIQEQLSERKLLDNCLYKYNQTIFKYEQILPELQKIKFNFIVKIQFSKLKNLNNRINKEISEIQEKMNENEYEKNKIISEIQKLNENLENFEKKYNQTFISYNKCQKAKKAISKFFKIFFISLFVGIAIYAIFIFVATFIVIKKQRKYYELKEEVTLEQGKEEFHFRQNKMKNNIKDKVSASSLREFFNNKRNFKISFHKLYKK